MYIDACTPLNPFKDPSGEVAPERVVAYLTGLPHTLYSAYKATQWGDKTVAIHTDPETVYISPGKLVVRVQTAVSVPYRQAQYIVLDLKQVDYPHLKGLLP